MRREEEEKLFNGSRGSGSGGISKEEQLIAKKVSRGMSPVCARAVSSLRVLFL